MATAAPETGLGRVAERRVYAVMFLAYFAIGAIGPLLPEIRRAFGASVGEVGLAISAFGLPRLLIDLPAGGLSERFGYRRLLLVGTLLWSRRHSRPLSPTDSRSSPWPAACLTIKRVTGVAGRGRWHRGS